MSKNPKPIQEATKEVASSTASVATMAEAGFPEVARETEQGSDAGQEETHDDAEPEEDQPAGFDLALYALHMENLPEADFSAAFDVMLSVAHQRGLITDPENEEAPEEPEQPAQAEEAQPEDEHASVRALLRRYELPQAWQDANGGYHFDETAAHAAQATTLIYPEV